MRIVDFARRNRLPVHLARPRARRGRGGGARRGPRPGASCRSCGCPAAPSCAAQQPASSRGRSASGSSSRRARRSTCSSSAAARPASAPPSTAPRRGSTRWCREHRARRPGRHLAADRELPRLPGRDQRHGADQPRGHPGAQVRRPHRRRPTAPIALEPGARPPPRPARGRPARSRRARSCSRPAPSTAACRSTTSTTYEGISVFYAAGPPEAQLCGATRVGVVGGGNSAGQAAVWLARGGALVTLLHRRADLRETMSDYLIDELERYGVAVRDRSEIAELHGDDGELEAVTLTDGERAAVLVPVPLPRRRAVHRLARRRRRARRGRLRPHRRRRRRRRPARDQRPGRLRRRRRPLRLDQALRHRGRRGRDGRALRPRALRLRSRLTSLLSSPRRRRLAWLAGFLLLIAIVFAVFALVPSHSGPAKGVRVAPRAPHPGATTTAPPIVQPESPAAARARGAPRAPGSRWPTPSLAICCGDVTSRVPTRCSAPSCGTARRCTTGRRGAWCAAPSRRGRSTRSAPSAWRISSSVIGQLLERVVARGRVVARSSGAQQRASRRRSAPAGSAGSADGTRRRRAARPATARRRRARSARAPPGRRARHGRHQRRRVRVLRAARRSPRVADLDDPAEVHDRDPVGDLPDHREVVRDEDVRQVELALQLRSRLRICAWIETSSAETGSSQTISCGWSASARATPIRWRWPPENSCG